MLSEKILKLPDKFRQKLGFSALFVLLLAESQKITFFSMKSRRKSVILAFFLHFLPKNRMKGLSAKFLAPSTLKNNREPWIEQ